MQKHLAVWIDHQEAKVFDIDADKLDELAVLAPLHNLHHKHPKGASEPHEHPNDAKRFFHEVARALHDATAIVVVGPGAAKLDLFKYLHKHEPALEPKVIGVETVDHPTDRQLVAYAKQYFKNAASVAAS